MGSGDRAEGSGSNQTGEARGEDISGVQDTDSKSDLSSSVEQGEQVDCSGVEGRYQSQETPWPSLYI